MDLSTFERCTQRIIDKYFEEIFIIHLLDKKIEVLDYARETSHILDYNVWLNQSTSVMPYIAIHLFVEQMNLEKICTSLNERKECYFVTYQTEDAGNMRCYQFSICYLDQDKKELLMTKQDCTSYNKMQMQYVNELQKDSERFRFIIKNICEDFGEINVKTGEAYMTTSNNWEVGVGIFEEQVNWLAGHVIIPEQRERYRREFTLENFVTSLRDNNGFYATAFISQTPEGQKHLLINSALLSNPLRPDEEYIFSFAQDITPLKMQEEKNKQLIDISQELIAISQTDKLTALLNRAAGENKIANELKLLKSNKKSMLLLLDIDYFKKINDSFGHSVGDYVLHYLGQSVQNVFHSSDILCRWGGDEFLFYIDDAENLQTIEEQLKEVQNRLGKCMYNSTPLPVTISMGGVFLNKKGDLSQVFLHVDRLLYEAKRNGRRCYILGECE